MKFFFRCFTIYIIWNNFWKLDFKVFSLCQQHELFFCSIDCDVLLFVSFFLTVFVKIHSLVLSSKKLVQDTRYDFRSDAYYGTTKTMSLCFNLSRQCPFLIGAFINKSK